MKVTITVTEATEHAAFLSNENGYDVAVLRRIVPQDHRETPECELLTDEQWQALINLIDAAPDILDALDHLQANPNDPRCHRRALDALTKAKGSK